MTSDDWCLESEGRTQLGIAGREECKASVRSKPSIRGMWSVGITLLG